MLLDLLSPFIYFIYFIAIFSQTPSILMYEKNIICWKEKHLNYACVGKTFYFYVFVIFFLNVYTQ